VHDYQATILLFLAVLIVLCIPLATWSIKTSRSQLNRRLKHIERRIRRLEFFAAARDGGLSPAGVSEEHDH